MISCWEWELTVLGEPPTMRSGLRHITLVLSTMAASTKVSRSKVISLLRMAPNLAESQHAQIRDMILSNRPAAEIADVVGCSERSVFAIKSNLRCFRSTKVSSNGVGRPRSITPWPIPGRDGALCAGRVQHARNSFQHRKSAEIPRLDQKNNSPYSKGTKC
jgi:hypothetical protein